MIPLTVNVPEPFRGALEGKGRYDDVVEADAKTPEALFGRALCRLFAGKKSLARADFLAAEPALGDACRVELALLDLQDSSQQTVEDARDKAQLIIQRSEPESPLAARAWHVVGCAQDKLDRPQRALEALRRATEIYGKLGQRLGLAQVNDTLGMVHSAAGRVDQALIAYSLSLVDKALIDDRDGMAITLGNLGRLLLRSGRLEEALECFRRDLEIAQERGELRGQILMHNHLGQVFAGLGRFREAEQELQASLALARGQQQQSDQDFTFFALKDMASLRLAENRLDEAEALLNEAERSLPEGAKPYLRHVAGAARGELLAARGDPQALELLDQAVRDFHAATLPDLEIPCRITLARAAAKCGLGGRAQRSLLEGLELARRNGYLRYLPRLNEAMSELGVVEEAVDERDRPIDTDRSAAPGGYQLFERLGGGAFGEVFRALDLERNREVALKRLHLDKLYDVARREYLWSSSRAELKAGSRVSHPGVVRVLSIGTEPQGGAYIVQELIRGQSLRRCFPSDASAKISEVVACLEKVADALAALHAAGVVHRDLKPENVLVRYDGSPVLVDFGIAHVAGTVDALAGRIVGTPEYMAPEQAQGGPVTGQADLYALGVMAFEWLTGQLPSETSEGLFEKVARHLVHVPRSLTKLRPDVPVKLERIILSLLSTKPEDRPASAALVARTLRELSAQPRART